MTLPPPVLIVKVSNKS